jgi:hypothetical protein
LGFRPKIIANNNALSNFEHIDVSNLRKKFEDDKKRIESMKQTRKFKPFWISLYINIVKNLKK